MQFFTGYIEGYYGKLLAWHDRDRLLDGLEAVGMTSYFYAPKMMLFIVNSGAKPMMRLGGGRLNDLPAKL